MPTANQMVETGVGVVVAMVVSLLTAAFLVPVALDEINDVDTSDWGSGTEALWGILGLVGVLVLFLTMIGWAVSAYRT